jgi:hypothetical protein
MASVWTGSNTSFEERCKILARIGFKGVDLPTVQQVPILKQNGLAPAMMTGTGTNVNTNAYGIEAHHHTSTAPRLGFVKGVILHLQTIRTQHYLLPTLIQQPTSENTRCSASAASRQHRRRKRLAIRSLCFRRERSWRDLGVTFLVAQNRLSSPAVGITGPSMNQLMSSTQHPPSPESASEGLHINSQNVLSALVRPDVPKQYPRRRRTLLDPDSGRLRQHAP